jgi:glucose/arabinose dehydrogenase
MTTVVRTCSLAAAFAAFVLSLPDPSFAAQSDGDNSLRPVTLETSGNRIRVTRIATQLEHPWSLAHLPNGDILVTERPGRLRIIRNGELDPIPIGGVPHVHHHLHGGLLDVAIHPQFSVNQLVYFTYAKAGNQGATVALARGRFDGAVLHNVEDVFVADAWSTTDVQYGSRIVFGRDGTLFMSVGERSERERAQMLSDHAGAILRIRDDGSVPDDNPFVGSFGLRPEIYSYGHRNVQGLATHPYTGALWASEHGPQGGDEVNLVMPGKNYGWPRVSLGSEYDGHPISDAWDLAGVERPIVFWSPSVGLSGMTFYTGSRLGSWTGDLFVGGLSGRSLQRVMLAETASYGREALLTELRARIRDVRVGPDELLYVVTDEDVGELLRIEPDDEPGKEDPVDSTSLPQPHV